MLIERQKEMNNFVQYFTEFSLSNFILSVFILLFCLRQAGDLLEWMQNKMGIETKTSRRIKSYESKVEKHDELLKCISDKMHDIESKLDKVSNKIDENEKIADHQRMKELRKYILDFANAMNSRGFDKEMCEEVFDAYEEYENLIVKWGEKNGRTTRAMNNIEAYYNSL